MQGPTVNGDPTGMTHFPSHERKALVEGLVINHHVAKQRK